MYSIDNNNNNLSQCYLYSFTYLYYFPWDASYYKRYTCPVSTPHSSKPYTRASHVRVYNIVRLLCAIRTSKGFAANRLPGAFIKMCNIQQRMVVCSLRSVIMYICILPCIAHSIYMLTIQSDSFTGFSLTGQTAMKMYERTCRRMYDI